MKRYYISPIIGSGTEDDPIRPKIADYGVNWVGVLPSDPNTGLPLKPWCLVLVEAVNHGSLLADSAIDALPEFPLDGKVNAINTAARNKLVAALAQRGIDATVVNNADGYRNVIRGIGQSLDARFDENNFDVA